MNCIYFLVKILFFCLFLTSIADASKEMLKSMIEQGLDPNSEEVQEKTRTLCKLSKKVLLQEQKHSLRD